MLEQASQSLMATDLTSAGWASIDDPVSDPLVRALPVVVLQVLSERLTQRGLAEEDHAIETFGLDREHEPLCKGVAVRSPGWRTNDSDSSVPEELPEPRRELCVSIADQEPVEPKKTIHAIREVAST